MNVMYVAKINFHTYAKVRQVWQNSNQTNVSKCCLPETFISKVYVQVK